MLIPNLVRWHLYSETTSNDPQIAAAISQLYGNRKVLTLTDLVLLQA